MKQSAIHFVKMWLQKLQRVRKSHILLAILCLLLILMVFRDRSNGETSLLGNLKREVITCKRPDLPVNAPEMMKFVKEVAPIDCSKSMIDWAVCEGCDCKITEEAAKKYGPITCLVTDILRLNDTNLKNGPTKTVNSTYKLERSDVIRLNCTGSNNATWASVLTGIRCDRALMHNATWDYVPDDGFQLNILMLGFDSLSHNTFIRKLPKSYKYMTDVLGTHVLNGYNIVGDGTPQALIPILTGKTELELPDARKRLRNTSYVNAYPFVWNDFQDVGYATGYFEDVPDYGVFTYRLNGFDEQPTDHYMRTYYVAAKEFLKQWQPLCCGSVPRHKVMFDEIKSFFKVYESGPKFVFGFHGELSHDDYNLVQAADDDLLKFFRDMHESNMLNNTLLIVMADHGHRFAEVRNTMQGKLEERLPFFSFTFPNNFKQTFAPMYEIFKGNLNKLSTPFDIHATFKSILNYVDIILKPSRGISLFNEIPPNRSCSEAGIEPHWCTCLDWTNVPLEEAVVQKLRRTFEQTVNGFTAKYRTMCAQLQVDKIHYVTKMRPNEDLIKFSKNADMDGFVPDLSARTKVNKNIYQIKVTVTPGDSIFEASILHYVDKGEFALLAKDISRINMYGKQARCVEENLPDLRKYCYCI